MKKLRITVDGKVFDVSVELLDQVSSTTAAPVPQQLPPPQLPLPLRPLLRASRTRSCRRRRRRHPQPLAGKVVSLDVAPGTAVKAGDQIMTLEAMKMNTIIYAPSAGTITSFCVNAATRCRKAAPGQNRLTPAAIGPGTASGSGT